MQKDYDAFYTFGDKVLRKMRIDAGLSQMELAERMGIAVQTVHKWENGKSCPDAVQTWQWYNACGVNHMPYVMAWQHPDRYKNAVNDRTVALMEAVFALDTKDQERLLYAITGNHGSFFPGALQLLLAHLHLPLKSRISSATLVVTQYNIEERKGNLVHTNRPMPNMDLLDRCIHAGTEACFDNRDEYTL